MAHSTPNVAASARGHDHANRLASSAAFGERLIQAVTSHLLFFVC